MVVDTMTRFVARSEAAAIVMNKDKPVSHEEGLLIQSVERL